MRRRDFAVDANVLRIVTRLGWLKEVRLGGAYCLVFEAVGPTEKRALLAKESMLLYTPPRKPKTLMQPTQPKVHLGVTTTTAGSDGAVEITVVLSVAVAKAPPPLKQMRIDDAMAGAPGGSGAGGVAATSQGVAAPLASPLAAATPVRCGDATGAAMASREAATVAAAAAVGDIEDLPPKAGGLVGAARPPLKRFAKNAHSWFRSRIDDSTPVNKLCAATLGRRSVAIQREALTPATLHHTGTSPTST